MTRAQLYDDFHFESIHGARDQKENTNFQKDDCFVSLIKFIKKLMNIRIKMATNTVPSLFARP